MNVFFMLISNAKFFSMPHDDTANSEIMIWPTVTQCVGKQSNNDLTIVTAV